MLHDLILAETIDWLLDADEPLFTMYACAEDVVPGLALEEFLRAIDEAVIVGSVELLHFIEPSGPLVKLDRVPGDLEERYREVGFPDPPDFDPLSMYLSLPEGTRPTLPWHLHDDLDAMRFELEVREGNPREILDGCEKVRPSLVHQITDERSEGGVRIISGEIRLSGR